MENRRRGDLDGEWGGALMAPLIPIALSLVPELARWIAGDRGGKVADAAVQVVRSVTGTDDPAAAQAAIRNMDPAQAAELQVRLAEIAAKAEADARAAELETLRVTLSDVQSARAQTVDLARAGSGTQWSATIVSFIVLLAFAVMSWAILTKAVPNENREAAMLMLGALSSYAGAAVAYWLGSSAGSAAKNALLRPGGRP
jgi:hypothetical protein